MSSFLLMKAKLGNCDEESRKTENYFWEKVPAVQCWSTAQASAAAGQIAGGWHLTCGYWSFVHFSFALCTTIKSLRTKRLFKYYLLALHFVLVSVQLCLPKNAAGNFRNVQQTACTAREQHLCHVVVEQIPRLHSAATPNHSSAFKIWKREIMWSAEICRRWIFIWFNFSLNARWKAFTKSHNWICWKWTTNSLGMAVFEFYFLLADLFGLRYFWKMNLSPIW